MYYTALYRKFRPPVFEQIVGQEHITKTLKNQIMAGRVGHAYLFNGGRGTGKTSAAKVLARAVNCLNPQDGEPCNECEICKAALEGSLTDIVEMDAASNNSVEDIRSIRDEVNFLPTVARYRVYIIDEVHMLSTGAFNALLKTLEEPPEFAIIILIGNNESLFLETIKSRCVILHFEKISNDDIKKYIEKNLEINNLSEDILKIFQGSIGKVNSLKDKIAEYENIKNIIDNINKKDLIDIINMSKIIYESKEEINSILEYINAVLIEKAINDYRFTKCIEIVENTKERLKNNGNYDMCIDNMLFNMWREIN